MHNHKISRVNTRFLSRITSFLPSLFWILFIYGFDEPLSAGATIICALIHELGHATFLLLKKSNDLQIRTTLSGFRIKKSETNSYIDDIWLYASGPLGNILSAILIFFLPILPDEYKVLFIYLNLVTAISNLLPIRTYDGYGIIVSLLGYYEKEEKFLPILNNISFALVIFLAFLSLYIVGRLGNSYWMAGLFVITIVGEVSERLKQDFSRLSEF